MRKRNFIFALTIILLLALQALPMSAAADCDPPKNGLCQMTFAAQRQSKAIIGKKYVYGCCDGNFTLAQFVEPDLLLFSWLPSRPITGSSCWGLENVLAGSRFLLKSPVKLFEELRRKRNVVGNLTMGDLFGGQETSRFLVLDVHEATLTDGRVLNLAVIGFTD